MIARTSVTAKTVVPAKIGGGQHKGGGDGHWNRYREPDYQLLLVMAEATHAQRGSRKKTLT